MQTTISSKLPRGARVNVLTLAVVLASILALGAAAFIYAQFHDSAAIGVAVNASQPTTFERYRFLEANQLPQTSVAQTTQLSHYRFLEANMAIEAAPAPRLSFADYRFLEVNAMPDGAAQGGTAAMYLTRR